MGLSKVKSTKQSLRLRGRIESYLKTLSNIPTQNQKAYKRPGSNKK